MGKRHALIWCHKVPSAKLVAVSTPDAEERSWAALNLAPYGVVVYEDYDEMLTHPGVQAVCVASATSVHPEQAIKAIKAGYHVVCEKPLGLTVEAVSTYQALEESFMSDKSVVSISRRCGSDAAGLESHVWIFQTIRRLLPGGT